MSLLHVAVVVGLTAVLVQVWLNLRIFPALVTAPMPGMSRARPRLSLLIPARNESVTIARCVAAWLSQTITPTELLVLDDESGDDTLERARAAVAGVPWAAALTGAPKPAGWSGKSFACHQLAQAARGDVLVFADADIVPEARTLQALTYDTFPEIWFGNIKNLFPILFCSRVLVALAVAGLVAGFVAPWLLLATAVGHGPFALIIAVVEIGLGLSSRLVISLRFRYAVVDSWSHPPIVLMLCVLLQSSAWMYRRASVHWRGRAYGIEIM